jgi:hypothetical protein
MALHRSQTLHAALAAGMWTALPRAGSTNWPAAPTAQRVVINHDAVLTRNRSDASRWARALLAIGAARRHILTGPFEHVQHSDRDSPAPLFVPSRSALLRAGTPDRTGTLRRDRERDELRADTANASARATASPGQLNTRGPIRSGAPAELDHAPLAARPVNCSATLCSTSTLSMS